MDELKKYKDYKTILSVNVLIWCKGKVLMLKRANSKNIDPGRYSGIGGKVEPHESFYDAIIREVKEETGITELEDIRMYAVTQHPSPAQNAEWINVSFKAETQSQIDLKPTEDGVFYWIDPKEIDNLEAVTDMKEYIKILSKNPNAVILGHFNHNSRKVSANEIKIF